MTWPLAAAVCVELARTGLLRRGVGVVVAHHCLLRVGELTRLRRADVADYLDARCEVEPDQQTMWLRLGKTKTGSEQCVQVLDPAVVALLRALVQDTAAGGRLFPFTEAQLAASMKAACAELGLSTLYTPHSLRHGGATKLFGRGWRVEDIMLRGRWASTTSTRQYIQSGPALLLTMAVPPDTFTFGRACADNLVLAFTLAQKHYT